MAFIQESPRRQLERSLGIERTSQGIRAGSWQKIGDGTPVGCGLLVHDIADPRHAGRIEAYDGAFARVRWTETRWVSQVRYANLRRVPDV